ncbi:hypothetical protein GIB67_005971 [Kingdonia uniflora]|uniref:U1-type domain-containing protein n=1 Tax=Kingdonia uniflora TaxID=39325 RepID=A0A7J7MBQ9_9MAGN|nr:hypothetical protein GIB67_005971 [Kingdonia uniflora]
MVWFQCEDCGENLKKPKLQNHFRNCSAYKLSCIDCGETFGQQSVQGHTQCITEAEKYGPKGQAKAPGSTPAKANNSSKQKPDIDVNVGLSSRPPWFCRLCNTSATSQQTLLGHADGKKHRAKARAFHAANQPPKLTEESTQDAKDTTGVPPTGESVGDKVVDGPKKEDPNESLSLKKRKLDASPDSIDGSDHLSKGEVIQAKRTKAEKPIGIAMNTKCSDTPEEVKEGASFHSKESKEKKIKWKKLITSFLKSNPDGALKFRKLQKLVFNSLQESGVADVEAEFKELLMDKIKSSSRFQLDNKQVRLVTNC